MVGWSQARGVSRVILAASLVGGAFFEFAAIRSALAGGRSDAGSYVLALYVFQLLIIAASIATLVGAFRATRHVTVLLFALGLASWLLGDLFYISYAVLLDRALMYPSVADLAFQGFHVAVISGLGSQIVRREERLFWPAVAGAVGICLLPAAVHVLRPYAADDLAYATFFMGLTAMTMMIAVGVSTRAKRHMLAGGMLLVVIADATFATASLAGAGFLYVLDPLWVIGFAATASAVIHATQDGAVA